VFRRGHIAPGERFYLTMADAPNEPPLEQVEFDINDVNSEVAQNTVRDAVKDLNGVRDVQFVGGGAIVTYNPLGITKEEICTAIRRSGYRATEITSAPPR
jgi:copper chaperone CopZ